MSGSAQLTEKEVSFKSDMFNTKTGCFARSLGVSRHGMVSRYDRGQYSAADFADTLRTHGQMNYVDAFMSPLFVLKVFVFLMTNAAVMASSQMYARVFFR